MPKKNGMEVVKEIRDLIKSHQDRGPDVLEPVFVFLTAFKTKTFDSFLESNNIHHCFEKPLSNEALIKLLNELIPTLN